MGVIQKILQLFVSIFGRWSWSPPQWLRTLNKKFWQSRVGQKLDDLIARGKKHPKVAMKWGGLGFAGLCLVGFGIFAIVDYINSLPQPDYVDVTFETPYSTPADGSYIPKLTVVFSKSAAKLDDVGKEVKDGVKITPAIAGVWKWRDDKHLMFDPKGAVAHKTDWLVGETYTVKFKKNFFPDHLAFKTYEYEFSTVDLNLSFGKHEFYIDPKQPKIKKAVATIYSNYPLDTEDFKKRIKMTLQTADNSALGKSGETLAPKISFNEYKNEAYIESPPIDMPKTDQVVKIVVEKGVRTRRGGQPGDQETKEEIKVPGRYTAFQIDEAKIIFPRNEKFEPEQVFVFGTGIAAKSEDVLKALKVYLLPADHTPPGRKSVVKHYNWNSASEVTPEVLRSSEALKLDMIPTEEAHSPFHSFKINVPVERSLYFEVEAGVKGLGDYELGRTYKGVVRVPDYTPELMFMSQGAILSVSGDKKLPLLARNVRHVQFEVGRVLPQQVNLLVAKMFESDNFSKPSFYSDVEDTIMERFHENQKLPMKSAAETTYFSLDLKPYIQDGRGFFYIKVEPGTYKKASRSDEGEEGYEGEGDGDYNPGSARSDRRLVMITDLGLIAKHTASGGSSVFVQNLRTGLPVAGATIEILGKNGIAILSQTTDPAGRADFPKLTEYNREKKPIAFLARHGGDVSYLPYRLNERLLSYSRFDVGGIEESSRSDQLTAMLFSDRGIYRPGDKVNIGLIMRSKKQVQDVKSLPLKISVTDPRGTVIKKENFPAKLFNLQDFQFTTTETSPAGNYNVQLLLIKKNKWGETDELVVGSTDVQVEEFVPDKLKINATFAPFKSKGWVPLQKIHANISLKNLFGTPAESRMIKAEATVSPISPSIAQFKNYTFINPNKKDAQSATEYLNNTQTDGKGEAGYDIDMSKYSGYYLLRLRAEGFEAEGGRAVETSVSVVASDLEYLVGFKADGGLTYINKDGARKVDLIAVNSDQAAIDAKVQLVLNEIKYVSSLVKQNDGTFKYQSVKKEIEVKKEDIKINKKGATLSLPTATPGDFVYVVKNGDGAELNKIEFRVVGDSNLARSLDRNAELQIVLNKEDFAAGEEIELQILAPYAGSGLITIERDTIYAQKWFTTSTNATIQRIKIPETLTGNAYVNVTFLRSIGSSEIYMSPLSYGIQPFSVSLEKQRTRITLKAPEKVKPGEKFDIQYSANRPTSIIVYGVDEGILQVAKYKTPDPLKFFFRKKALQVQTFQLLDLLLPEYSLLQQKSSTGGDAEAAMMVGNLNPFKAKSLAPVVFWSGVLNADTTAKKFSYTVPEYFNGNIKIMAVASSAGGLGASDGGSLVRGDFIISPTAPVFVTPSDEIHVGMNVSNQVENPKSSTDVKIALTTSDALSVIGEKEKTIKIPQGREVGTEFVIKAGDKLGVADLQITASNGTESARFTHQLSLRPAVPFQTTLQAGFTDSLPLELKLDRKLYAEKAEVTITASPSPIGLLPGVIQYLNDFPYSCTEQIVAQAIPHLVLGNNKSLEKWTKSTREAHDRTMAVLRTRQTSQGGFNLWGEGSADDIPATMSAVDYILEAQARGFDTPEDITTQLLAFLKSPALRKGETLFEARFFARAIYDQARFGILPSNDFNFLLELLEKNHKGRWEKDSTAFFVAGTYQLLQQGDKGWALLKGRSLGEDKTVDYYHHYSPGVRDAQLVQIIARHYPEKFVSFLTEANLKELVKPLLSQHYSTVESSQLILAFSTLNAAAEKKNFPAGLVAKEWVMGAEKSLALSNSLVAKADASYNADKVSLAGGDYKPLFYSLSQRGFDRELPRQEIKNQIEVSRVFDNRDGSKAIQVKAGDEIQVSLRLRGLQKTFLPYIAVVDMFPAGFELIRDSVEGPAEFIDKREDRLIAYTSADQNMKEFKYKLKATHKGKFTVPPAFAESMYDKSVQYRGVAHQIEVK